MSNVIPFEPHRTSFVEVDGSPDGDELTRNLLVVEAGIAFVADGLADLRKQEQRIASEREALRGIRQENLNLAYTAFEAALKTEGVDPRQILEEFIRFRRNRNPEKVLHSERIVGNFDKLKPGAPFIDRSGHGPIAGICQTQPELLLGKAPKSGRPKIFVGFNFLHHPRIEDDDRSKYEKDKVIPVTQLGKLVVGSDLSDYATKIAGRLEEIAPSGKLLFTEARAESFLILNTLGLEYGFDFKKMLVNYKKLEKNKYKPVDLL